MYEGGGRVIRLCNTWTLPLIQLLISQVRIPDILYYARRICHCWGSSFLRSCHPHHLHLRHRLRDDGADHPLRPRPHRRPGGECHRSLLAAKLLRQHHPHQEAALPAWHHPLLQRGIQLLRGELHGEGHQVHLVRDDLQAAAHHPEGRQEVTRVPPGGQSWPDGPARVHQEDGADHRHREADWEGQVEPSTDQNILSIWMIW